LSAASAAALAASVAALAASVAADESAPPLTVKVDPPCVDALRAAVMNPTLEVPPTVEPAVPGSVPPVIVTVVPGVTGAKKEVA